MLKERLQVLIDRDQRKRLEREAADRGTSIATLVREAIDLAFPSSVGHRRATAERILNAPPMRATDVTNLLEEIDQARGRRG